MKTPKVKKKKYRVKMATYVYVWAENEDEACDKVFDQDPSEFDDWDVDGVEETDEYYEDDIIPDVDEDER